MGKKRMTKALSLLLVMFTTMSITALANGTYYAKAKATAVGEGKVYVGVNSTQPAEELYQSSTAEVQNTASSSSGSANVNFYLFSKPEANKTLEGWYDNEECTGTSLGKSNPQRVQISSNVTSSSSAETKTFYAKFVDSVIYYSQVTAIASIGGNVFVSADNNAEGDYSDTSVHSQKVADKTSHTYYLKAQKNDGYIFEGWYSDAPCTQLIATTANYTYTVTSESTDENNPTEVEVYALFSERNGYQVINGGFEKWTDNEPAPGWNSFPSAVGAQAALGKTMSPNPEKVEGRNGGSAVRLFSQFAGSLGVGANANGNLTTGRVNMGAMTPADQSNHNFSDLENEGYFLTIAGQPDGVEFYSKYKMGDGDEHQGHAQFIIHDAVNYIDPQREEQKEHRIGQAETFIAESENWELQTAEFQYDWSKDDAAATLKYLLINFTTNNTPGGSKDDELILDDVRLIYNSELTGAKYDGQNITFAEGQATVSANYDATLLTELTSNGRGASIETSYNNETSVLTITVMGEDYNFNTDNKHEYTVQFGATQADFDAQLQYNEEDNTVTITVNDESVTYFAAVEDKEYYDMFYGNDSEYMAEAWNYTERAMSGNTTISANTIYKDAYYQNMDPDLDYYFLLSPCTVDENGWPVGIEGAPVFKIEFHCSNVVAETKFNYTDNGDATFTIEPKEAGHPWYAVVISSEEFNEMDNNDWMSLYFWMDITTIDQAYMGTKTLNADELYSATHDGESITTGEYVVLVGTIITGVDEGEVYIYPADAEHYNITISQTTGVGTVLRPEATKTIYNLQGQRLQRQQRGVNLVGSKKVVR